MNFLNLQIRIGIASLILFISIGEFHGIPLRKYIYLPFFLIFIGTVLKYKSGLFSKFIKIPITIPLFIGIAMCLFSVVNSLNVYKSIKVFSLLISGALGLYFLLVNLLSKEEMQIFLFALLLGFLYITIIGIHQYFYFFRGFRIYSTWSEPNGLGDYLVIALPLFCSFALLESKTSLKVLCIGAFMFGYLSLVLTYSRGAWLGATGGLIFLLINKKRTTLLLSFVGVITILLSVPSLVSKRARTIIDPNYPTNMERILAWKSAFKMIKDHPLTGIGIGNFSEIYPEYKEPSAYRRSDVHSCNNLYLHIPVEIGILGFPLFLYAVVILFKKGFKFLREQKDEFWKSIVEGALAALVGALILGFFEG